MPEVWSRPSGFGKGTGRQGGKAELRRLWGEGGRPGLWSTRKSRAPSRRATEEKHQPGEEKSRVESRLCSALSHVHPLEQDAHNTQCLSFPICRMGPTSQPMSEGKLGRLQGVTGQTAPTLPRAGLSALPSWCSTNLASHLLLTACAAQPSHLACPWSLQRTPSDDHLVHGKSSHPLSLSPPRYPPWPHGKKRGGTFPLARLPLPRSKVGGRGRSKSC